MMMYVCKIPTVFRKLIGALQYVTNTRPDITFLVNKLSRYLSSPTVKQWQSAKRILRYLKGTLDYGIHLKPSSHLSLYGFCDADWGVAHEHRKSISGYCVFLSNSLVSWSSKRQHVVSRSSTESEYRAIEDVACELAWISSLLQELKCPVAKPVAIWSDNLGAGALAANPVYHSRTKHVEIDVHFIRDKVAS